MEIKNTAPLVIGEYPNQKKLTRRFLGNLFPKNTFENNELKAYLKGHIFFQYKGEGETVIAIDKMGQPVYGNRVRQEYFYQ